MDKKQRLDILSKNFGESYYESPSGTGLGRSDYRWESGLQLGELEKKLSFMETHLPQPWKSVLFLGCAKGYEVKFFRDKGYAAYGVDVSEYAIRNALSDVKEYCFREDICDLSRFDDNAFDVVASFDTLQMVKKDRRENLFKEVSRVTSKYLMLRISILPPWMRPTDTFCDGDEVYLDPLRSWIDGFQHVGKFLMNFVLLHWSYIAWCVFIRKEGASFEKFYDDRMRHEVS